MLVGIWVLLYLEDSIKAAKWLQPEEKRLLEQRIAADGAHTVDHGTAAVFRDGRVWLYAAIYFCFIMGLCGVSFWLPQLIKSMGVKEIGGHCHHQFAGQPGWLRQSLPGRHHQDATGSATLGLYAIAASLFVGAALILGAIPKPSPVTARRPVQEPKAAH